MRMWRLMYLALMLTLALAHVLITLTPWTSPVWGATLTYTWLVALFAGWLLAAVLDLAMSLLRVMPLSFAVESVAAMLSLAILATMPATLWLVLLCALAAPVWVVVKAIEELTGHTPALQQP